MPDLLAIFCSLTGVIGYVQFFAHYMTILFPNRSLTNSEIISTLLTDLQRLTLQRT